MLDQLNIDIRAKNKLIEKQRRQKEAAYYKHLNKIKANGVSAMTPVETGTMKGDSPKTKLKNRGAFKKDHRNNDESSLITGSIT